MKINVLDEGYVLLRNWMGDDLAPVNDAKVSYDKMSDEFGDKEERLINFLGREGHTSPFRHSILKFEVYAPLMVARQWWKYVIGSDHADQSERSGDPFLAWNESSRRYITEEPKFYLVDSDKWRSAPDNSKQGSGSNLPVSLGSKLSTRLMMTYEHCMGRYEWAIQQGVAPEQARLFLPAYGMYVRWVWTASLQGVCHFLNQRLAHDAQKEIQEYAKAIYALSQIPFPKAVDALVKQEED